MMAEERRVIIHEPWWLRFLKGLFFWVGFIVLIGAVGYAANYTCGEYGIAGLALSLIWFVIWPRILMPPSTKVLEADIEKGVIEGYLFPLKLLGDEPGKFRLVGEHYLRFRDKKGRPVLVAERIDFQERTIYLSWVHGLTGLDFLVRKEAFLKLRDDYRGLLSKYGKLALLFAEMLKAAGVEEIEFATAPFRLRAEELLSPDVIERVRRWRERVLARIRPASTQAGERSP